MQTEKKPFQNSVLPLLAQQEPHPVYLKLKSNEQKHRKEEVGLVFHEALNDPSLPVQIVFPKGNDRNIDIGVEILLIRMTVMFVMFLYPPGITHAYKEIADNETNQIVFPRGMKHLPVSGIMAEEPELRGDNGEKNSIEELKPEWPNEEQKEHTQDEH